MPKPTLTADQIAAVSAQAAQQTAKQSSLSSAASLQDTKITAAQSVDSAFKAFFDYYNGSIIAKYDAERKALNGVFQATPVIETDLLNVAANPPTGRLIPTSGYDILRIAEFDGGNTSTSALNEQQHITDQATIEGQLTSGFGGTAPVGASATTTTATGLTPASTTLGVTDSATNVTFANGNIFIVESASASAVVQVTSVTQTSMIAPYAWTLGITQLVSGTVATAATITTTFTGFTNAERTAKTATHTAYQSILTGLVTSLQAKLNARLSRLSEQLAAIAANQDPDATAALASANTNCTTSQSFLTAYLVSTDISNTGLASLASERGTRSTAITARVAAIGTAYTGQTENYYNARYQYANNRANLQRGSLREITNAQGTKDTLTAMAGSMGSSISALNSLLGP